MSNDSNDLPPAMTNIADGFDTARDTIRTAAGAAELPAYAKVGTASTALQIGLHARAGEYENVAQDIGVAALQTGMGIALGTVGAVAIAAGAPVVLTGLAVAGAVWAAGEGWNNIIDLVQDNPQWLDPLFPDPTNPDGGGDTPSRDYRIEYYDPLVLDLNADGEIGTLSIDGFQGALFDHDNDGIRTASGWVSPEDGLLVRDLNNDGLINSGNEVFGDNTQLSSGDNAANGFAALSDLDTNNDGIVDDNDTNFEELKVWRDLNRDGISQSGELYTLDEVGVESLNTNIDSIQNQQVDGGYIVESGTFTRSDGTTGQMVDVNFEKNDAYTKYSNQVDVSNEILALPEMKGFGRLKDLHQAAMQSTNLKNILTLYLEADTRTQQKALLDDLLSAWTESDPLFSNNPIEVIGVMNVTWVQSKDSDNVIYVRRGDPIPSYLTTPPPPPEIASLELTEKVRFVDALLGKEPTTKLNQYSTDQTAAVEHIYNLTKDQIFVELLSQTLLKPYLDAIELYISLESGSDEMFFDFTPLEQLLADNYQADPVSTLEDLKDLLVIHGQIMDVGGWEKGFVLLQEWRNELSVDPLLEETIEQIFADLDTNTSQGTNQNDFNMITSPTASTYDAHQGNDTIIVNTDVGLTVYGGLGDDILVSGKGNDFLSGDEGNNTYIFFAGSGNDFVNYSHNGVGTDKLTFADVSFADAVFYQQDQNLVIAFGGQTVTLLGALDISSTKEVKLHFDGYVTSLQEILAAPLQNLENTSDNTYINGWRGIDLLTGTNADNQIYGFDGNDTLIGAKGNDRLIGGNGQDVYNFSLGDGEDEIIEADFSTEQNVVAFQDVYPADISQILFSGNDLIIVYSNVDKIILKNYLINSHNSELSLKFADNTVWNNEDLMSMVTFEGSSDHESIIGTLNDRLNIINAYGGNDDVQGNEFAENLIDGGAGNDQLYGGNNIDELKGGLGEDFIFGLSGSDIIHGEDGDDTLFGGLGDDVIIGGLGNDWLQGDGGADSLTGGLGDDSYDVDGNDIIFEYEGEGYDAIFIEDNFDLAGTHLEEIHLKGSGDFSAIGDEKDNGLYGNEGNNYLDGKGGADILSGGAGDDHYVVDKYDLLSFDANGLATLNRGDQVVEGLLNPAGYVFGDSGGIDTVEQWDDHRFYAQDENGDWFDTGKYHVLQDGIENLILKGEAKVAFGNNLDNIIVGNVQDNYIDGGTGDDTYVFAQGGGTDTYSFSDDINAINILKIEGYSSSEVYAQQYGDSVQLRFRNSEDKIWLSNYAVADDLDEGVSHKFDQIIFDNGEVWTTADVDALVLRAQNNHAPEVQSYPSSLVVEIDETIQHSLANLIIDPDADDELSFSLTLSTQDSEGNYEDIPDWVQFDVNTQIITVAPHEDVDVGNLQFWLWATDLYGQSRAVGITLNIQPSANTPIEGAIYDTAGNDTLVGGTEDNIFFYTSGQDTLQEAGGIDILRFSNGITFNQVGSGLMKSGNDLVLIVDGNNSNKVTLKNFFLAGEHLVETIDFETGGQITAQQLFDAFGVTMPEPEEPENPDPTDPNNPNPTDVTGDTTYQYMTGELNITEQSGTDQVIFGNGITFSQVGNYLTKSGDDLILKVNGSNSNKVVVNNFFLGGQYLVENFQFEAGGAITAEQIFGAFGMSMPEPEPTGGTGTHEATALEAFDSIYTYTSGAMTITEDLGADEVVFSNGIGFSQVGNYLTKSGNDLILKVDGSNTNKVTVKDFFLGGANEVETIRFETGGSISSAQLFNVFGIQRPLNAEDQTDQAIIGEDQVIDIATSDASISEIFALGTGADVVELNKLADDTFATDYWTDFNTTEDQIDLGALLDGSVNSGNINNFVTMSYDANLKTNTMSVKTDVNGSFVDSLVFTNQSEALTLQDLLNQQAVIY